MLDFVRMAGGPETVQKNLPGSAGDWEFLYSRGIPFQHQLHVFCYHFPGIFCSLLIGLMTNMLLEEVLKRISRRVAEHFLVTLVWMGLVVYLIFFTPFDSWLATKIHWYQIVPSPYSRTR